ncbi:glutamate racemase [Spirochaetia bacterium]|nr:glutamate racemase [Spirochaetia bacterium]
MSERNTVVFVDSGIGGIPYLRHFRELGKVPNITLPCAYIADNSAFPYGEKTKDELLCILKTLVIKACDIFNPKIIVLACNTASVSTLTELREYFPKIEFVGTVPAVKPAVMYSRTGNIGLLGTERTISDPYAGSLVHSIDEHCKLHELAAPDLVEFVENKLHNSSEDEKQEIVRRYVDNFRGKNVDGIVLGCTHFLFLKEIFVQAGLPDITIYDSVEGVCKRVMELFYNRNNKNNRNIENNFENEKDKTDQGAMENKFAITKNCDKEIWEQRAADLGMKLVII